jgi:hypothetical protein
VIAYTITVAGFIFHFWAHKDNPSPGFGTLLRCLIVVACITLLPMFHGLATTVFYYIPKKLLTQQAGINFAGDRIRELVLTNSARPETGTFGFMRFGFDKFFKWLLSIFFSGVATTGSFVLLPFYFIQRFGEMIGFAFMPIALACLTVPALAGKATTYVLSILSVLAWPLGFVLSSVAANSVLDVAIMTPPAQGTGLILLFVAPLVAATVLIVGTTSTPLFSYYLFTSGGAQMPTAGAGQMGSAMRSMSNAARGTSP